MRKIKILMTVVWIITILAALPLSSVDAASSGPNIAGTGVDGGGGINGTWNTPLLITADDGSYSTTNNMAAGTDSHTLTASGFGFNIDTNATITGISVNIDRYASGSSVRDTVVQLVKAGTPTGNNNAIAADWPIAPGGVQSYSPTGANALWGTTWSPAQINAADFGVILQVHNYRAAGNRTASVDYISITVTYTMPPTLSVTNSPVTYNGSPQAVTLSATDGGSPVAGTFSNVQYNGSLTVPTNAGTYAITANFTPTDTTNYSTLMNASAGNFIINAKALTITASDESKSYGDTFTFSGTEFTPDGLVNSDTVTSVTLTSSGAPTAATVTGSPYAIVASSAVGTGLDNYDIAYVDGSFTVDPKDLTITSNDQSKTYGDAITFLGTEFTPDGLVNSDTVTSVTLTSSGAPTAATVTGSPYAIVASSAVGTGLDNYDIAYVDGSFTVDPKDLTITSNDQSKTYGDAITFLGTEFTPDGLVNSDTITSVTLTSDGAPATTTVAGSPYAIVASAAVGTGLENYDIAYVDGSLTVILRELSITADDQSKTYGDAVTFSGTEFTPAGLVNSDTVTSVALTSDGATATATVSGSPYAIVASAATGTGLDNYDIAYVDGSFTVDTKDLTITADDQGKTYGDAFTFLGTEFTPDGLVNSDTVTSVALTSDGATATATVSGSPYAIVASAVTGTGLDNYDIAYVDGSFTVDTKDLTITADDQGKTYGNAFTFLGTEFTPDGLVNSDTVSSVTLTSDGAPATAIVAGSPYTIVASAAIGTGLENYAITYADGNFTVGLRTLTITADDQGKTYGDVFTFLGTEFTLDDLVNADTVSSVTLTSDGTLGAATVAGSPYAIVASAATGTGLDNYDIDYVDGSLTVGLRELTIFPDELHKTYGDPFTFLGTEFTAPRLVTINGDAITYVELSSDGVGAVANVGSHDILSDNAAGTGLENYHIIYGIGHLFVDPKDLTITGADQSKTYGDSFTFLGTEFTPDGLVNSDTVSSVTLTSDGAPATAIVADSPYAIVASEAVGNGLENYDIAYVDGRFTVGERPITITADALSKTYGDADPTLTYAITTGSLALSDTFSGALERVAGENVAGSPYAISQGTLSLGTNYNLTFVGANLTVTKRPLTITADAMSKLIGTADPTFTYTITAGSLAFSDAFTGTLSRDPGEAAGTYAITIGNLALTEDYEITFVGDFLTIYPYRIFLPIIIRP